MVNCVKQLSYMDTDSFMVYKKQMIFIKKIAEDIEIRYLKSDIETSYYELNRPLKSKKSNWIMKNHENSCWVKGKNIKLLHR